MNIENYQLTNAHTLFEKQQSTGESAADAVARMVGSWRFIIVQSILIALWVVVNSVAFINHWDGYPYILMNLGLSMQAALTAPVIMMSQNRQAARDRIESHNDYQINLKAESEVRQIMQLLEENGQRMQEIQTAISQIQTQISSQNK
jgi:uncharacterized membrane protein